MNKIFVPIDFSEASKNALNYAVQLAAHHNAHVLVLHAYLPSLPEPYLVAAFQDELEMEQARLAEKYFNEIRLSLAEEYLDQVMIDFRIELGGAVETIIKVAESWQPDITLLGMRSGAPFAKKLFGSTTSGVIQRLNSPVMVIPAGARFQTVNSVLFASDLDPQEVQSIKSLKTLLNAFHPELTCVHVSDHSDIEEDLRTLHLKKVLREAEQICKSELVTVVAGDVSEGILSEAGKRRADLIAMRTHLRGFWSRMVHASHSRDLARKTTVPLVIFPDSSIAA